MEIKSSLLNEHDYKFVKQSLIQASLVDGEQDTRVKICHFLVDNAVDSDTEFFLENFMFLRFPDPNDDGIGWTDKNGLIYLNCPTQKFENKPVYWDFVYCHECLHQIWGTFDVEEKLIREFGADKFNHQILNIASDCVINDWLIFKYKKKYPDIGLITPEYLKEQFDIEYDRNVDTQYGLYLKLIEKVDELLKDKNIQDQLKKHFERDSKIKDFQDELDKIGELDSDDKGPSGGGGTPPPPQGPWHPDADEAEKWAKKAQDYADAADKVAKELEQKDPNKGAIMKNRASIAQNAADASKDAAKKSRECADNGDKEGEEANARSAADFCGVAQEALEGKKAGGGKGGDQQDNDGPLGPRTKNNKNQSQDDDSDKNSSSAQDSADKAKDAANRAQKAADDWKDKAQQDPSNENKEAADNAQKAADEAKEAANKAQAAADKAKDASDKGNASGEAKADVEAAKAAKAAEEAAQRAQEGLEKQQSGNGTADEANDAQKEAESAAAAAKAAAHQKEEEAKQSGSKEAKEAAEYAKGAAEDAEEAANAAKKAAQEAQDAKQRGDKEAEAAASEKAKRAAEDAKDAAQRAQTGKKTSNHSQKGGTNSPADYTFEPEDLDRIRNERQKLNKRYANELGGALGEFANKCRKSLQLNPSMIGARTNKGKSSWRAKLETEINAFVKNKLRKFKQYEQTYKRIRRGTGVPKMGDIIKPGKRVKDNKLDIRVGFYVDRSGSMSGCINQVWEALYRIGDGLVKNFGRDKYVEDVSFDVFAFDNNLYKVKYGKKMPANGGTMSFEELMGYVEKHTKENLVNIILTDAGFSGVDLTKVKDIISKGNLFVFITNDAQDSTGIKQLSEDKNITNLIYIKADANFTI
jgi:hypothetical protein